MKRSLGFFVAALFTIQAGGCAPPTVTSPLSGKPVTGDALVSEIARKEAEIAKQDAAERAKAEAAVRAEKAKAEAEVRRIAANAKIADARREQELADVTARAAVNTEAIIAAAADARAVRDASLAALKAQADDAFDALKAQYEQRSGIAKVIGSLPVVGQYASAAGVNSDGVSTILAAAFGMGGMGWLSKRAKQREDAAWDEAHEKAKAEADAAKAKAEALQAQMLALMLPPPGQKANP